MYSDYNTSVQSVGSSLPDTTWIAISAILAIVGGIVIYFLFVADRKEKYTGSVAKLHDFLNFKRYFINMVLKILYLVATIFITLSSFSFLSVSVATFFIWLILGNIISRVVFEFILMLLTLVDNTTEINNKLDQVCKKKEFAKAPAKPRKKEKVEVVELNNDYEEENSSSEEI